MNSKKLLSLALAFVMALSLAAPAMAAEEKSDEIKILYTNDVHTYINNTREVGEGEEKTEVPGLRYSTIAAYKKESGADFLVDAGDHIQGTVYGAEDQGETIIKLMGAAGYTVSTLGNHEFDYNMSRTVELVNMAEYDYVSCNIFNTETGEQLLESFKVYEAANGKKVAFVGFTTPESITKSTPSYFMNEAGEIVWTFAEGDEGAKLYATAQENIDAAAKVADYVIGVGHMGVDEASVPYTSEDIIANTNGMTAFIDGHSHTTMEMKEVANKDGDKIILTQTGCYLAALGEMTIAADGTVTTKLLSAEDLADVTPDPVVAKMEDDFITAVDAKLGEAVGALEMNLTINGPDGKRSIRKEETNLGNFCLDALMYEARKAGFDPDMAFVQGGGIRATLSAGEVSTKDLKMCYPWDGENTIKEVTGQELLDALEWSYRTANVENTNEVGGFLQLSGMRVWVNLAIPSTVQQNDQSIWTGGPTGEYRVQKVEVQNKTTGEWEPLDLNKTYSAVCGTYIFEEMGDGYNMFTSGDPSAYVCPDYIALVDYIQSFPVNEETGLHTVPLGAGYDEFVHMGRINYIYRPADLDENEWWNDTAIWALDNKVMKGTDKGFEATASVTAATVYQTLYNLEGNTEEAEGEWYAAAMAWASANGLYQGDVAAFTDGVINRGEVKEILEAYCAMKNISAEGLMKGNEKGDLMLEKDLTRAEFAQLLKNINKDADKADKADKAK